ncbi:MAG TPA: PilC/PilY family type IV pilus protein [Thermoanaerobaculia bacterium]|nr:PilC/PilY family type IV pilus protein [Thermoanaerobaculia bacterium]
MNRHLRFPSGKAAVLAVAALTATLGLGDRPGYGSDIDLLRFNTSKPYVFFALDTSASMSLSPDGKWVHANGDDPRSKLYQAKKVLWEVFQEVDDIQFGFAAMNQDKAGVVNKHWLYYYTGSAPGGWPIAYPTPDPDGPVQAGANGTVIDDVEGDLLTFGPHFDSTGVAGTCAAPLALSTQREKINRYSKLGAAGNGPTVTWISSGGKTYRLTVSRPGNKPDTSVNKKLGEDGMNVRFVLEEIRTTTCAAASPTVLQTYVANLDLTLWTDFLAVDENVGSTTAPTTSKTGGVDSVGGFWDYKDIRDIATCGSGHPFSGKGWEGNYDGASSGFPGSFSGIDPNEDPYCNPADSTKCYNLKETTQYSALGRPLDKGDVIPLHWSEDNKEAFLNRLAPNQSSGTPDFRIASYFKDSPDSGIGALQPTSGGQVPLFASGPSPLSKMVIDFRCWYLGDGNKCNETAYNPGWEAIAKTRDSAWGCRRPYLIVLSDGGDSCPGENPCADTANLNSKGGIRTWVIAYGADCAKAGNPLKCMAQNGKGELLCPQNSSDLKAELLKILGLIREEARAFASAAVPSVQAIVDDKVFLTNFTPLNSKPVWDGHVHSFLKPLPLRATDGKPDTTHPNHVWDAGEVMKLNQVNATDPLGANANQRRVYYSRETASGMLSESRRSFDPTAKGTDPNDVRYDLWRGLEISFVEGNTASETAAETAANTAIQKTLALKTSPLTVTNPATGQQTTTTISYILGDIFHSNPIVLGSPPNTQYFANDINNYRDYFDKHELRRKMLVVGSNDGMLHAFDAGLYSAASEKFDNGTGKELFAYIPRTLLPTVKTLTTGSVHQWGVDGTVTVGDVFIDPRHNGVPAETEREWRTVVFGGLREGGSAYYALDITQPDVLAKAGETENVPAPSAGYVPSCSGESGFSEAACGPLPFPSALWEFTDSVQAADGTWTRLNEDNNEVQDLGDTWSVPNVGRIRITEGGATVDKYVMVVGGGLDKENKTAEMTAEKVRGNWLYMIDVETGRAIYKRQLDGSVPAEPAAVDTDQDGYLDRIYVGTTRGKMYRVDLVPDSSGVYPSLVDKPVLAMDKNTYTVKRIADSAWVPRIVFDANTENGAALAPGLVRPIYYRPSVIFVTRLGRYALSFGVGDREDLWNYDGLTGRIYVFVDDSDDLPSGTVFDEGDFERLTVDSPKVDEEFLLQGEVGGRGWYMVLDANERLITEPFALSGVSFFSSFKPDVQVTGGKDPLCSKTGISRIFVLSTTNGNPFLTDAGDNLVRHLTVSQFVTSPFTEQGLTKNVSSSSGGGPNPSTPPQEICDTPTQQRLKESLKKLFPVNCKFSNQTVDIKTISADTRLLCIAPIPVCTIEKNWKEH